MTSKEIVHFICIVKFRGKIQDFPGGPVVKNLPCNSEDTSSIPGQETKIPGAAGQLSQYAQTTEPVCSKPAHYK